MMYNLYQSKLRIDINTKVYHKPSFSVELFGQKYFGIIKTKKVGPFVTRWYQIMGISLPDDKYQISKEIRNLKNKYGNSFSNIFFQLGFINEIISFDNKDNRDPLFKDDMRQIRLNIRGFICQAYGLENSFRENMPQSTIAVDITKSDEELFEDMSSQAKVHIKKAIKNELKFSVLEDIEYESFYQKRRQTAGTKGFNIIPYSQYLDLVKYITDNKSGKVFVVRKQNEIVSGSICLFDQHRIIYLYGFSDRKFGNIGGHQFLKYKLFGWGRENGFTYLDMFGGAPTGFPEHSLHSVSLFKESLGGKKIEYYGNYDLVLNKFLYKIFRRYFNRRHK